MKHTVMQRLLLTNMSVLAIALGVACSTTAPGEGVQAGQSAESPAPERGGAELWAANCARCHNIHSPSSHSDAEWDVAMHHMRVRANLTAIETRRILEFLKSAN